jgi:septum formation topological specificity factor MinE
MPTNNCVCVLQAKNKKKYTTCRYHCFLYCCMRSLFFFLQNYKIIIKIPKPHLVATSMLTPLPLLTRRTTRLVRHATSAATEQAFAKSVREHFTNLPSTTWESPSMPFAKGWPSFFKSTQSTNLLLSSPAATQQLTAMLSYPISLAWFMQHHITSPTTDKPLQIHIIGARAEAFFPDYIWQLQSDIYTARQQHVHVSLFGPMVVDLGSKNDRTVGNLRITHHPNTLYHNVAEATPHGPADLFCCFHPGK